MPVDTHCHLNFEWFDQDRDEVIARAVRNKVCKMLNPAVDLETSRGVLCIADKYPEVYAAVGIHPNDSDDWDDDAAVKIRGLVESPKVIAIGEIGLDYYRERAPLEQQKQVFKEQLDLAGEFGLPVIIHSRNASQDNQQAIEDILLILDDWVSMLERDNSDLVMNPGVLHSFSSDLAAARAALDMNFFLGISGCVTFKNAELLRDVVANTPLENQLIETDAPFLTPHPYRGKRNEPAYVIHVAEKLAELHGTIYDDVVNVTTKNAGSLFNW